MCLGIQFACGGYYDTDAAKSAMRVMNLLDKQAMPTYSVGMTEIAETLDALGLLCPLPVLKARRRLRSLPKGAVLQVLADDPAAVVDIPHFCTEAGHTLIKQADRNGSSIYLIQKGD